MASEFTFVHPNQRVRRVRSRRACEPCRNKKVNVASIAAHHLPKTSLATFLFGDIQPLVTSDSVATQGAKQHEQSLPKSQIGTAKYRLGCTLNKVKIKVYESESLLRQHYLENLHRQTFLVLQARAS
ncbi:hypothetical protein ACJ41O_010453 [Fusarium nematophilum]